MTIELAGGLGDAFINLHETASYEAIASLVKGQSETVYINSHNPFVDEIFRWHPKADRIRVVKAPKFFLQYHDVEARRAAGFPDHAPPPHPKRSRHPIAFFPSRDDFAFLRSLPPRYVALSVSAGGAGRNLPAAAVETAISCCRELGLPVVALGRTYDSTYAKRAEVPVQGAISAIDLLSVPGTAMALERSRAAVVSHSALLLLSWYYRKPVFTVYPDSLALTEFRAPCAFSFGMNYPETVHGTFSSFRPERLRSFLEAVR